MNEKEERVLKEIIVYIKNNNIMPTRRYLQKKLNYKSINSITRYINSLEKQNYLVRNEDGKLTLSKYYLNYQNNFKSINIINEKNTVINLIMDKKKKYLAYKINNNYFNDAGIIKKDVLIIEEKSELKTNDIGLFIIDKKYRIMKYDYKDGFYVLRDNEEILLNRVKILGKVIMVERKLWEIPKVLAVIHIIRSWT